jgi:hypothetical protein
VEQFACPTNIITKIPFFSEFSKIDHQKQRFMKGPCCHVTRQFPESELIKPQNQEGFFLRGIFSNSLLAMRQTRHHFAAVRKTPPIVSMKTLALTMLHNLVMLLLCHGRGLLTVRQTQIADNHTRRTASRGQTHKAGETWPSIVSIELRR